MLDAEERLAAALVEISKAKFDIHAFFYVLKIVDLHGAAWMGTTSGPRNGVRTSRWIDGRGRGLPAALMFGLFTFELLDLGNIISIDPDDSTVIFRYVSITEAGKLFIEMVEGES